jgi:hypothetical protein
VGASRRSPCGTPQQGGCLLLAKHGGRLRVPWDTALSALLAYLCRAQGTACPGLSGAPSTAGGGKKGYSFSVTVRISPGAPQRVSLHPSRRCLAARAGGGREPRQHEAGESTTSAGHDVLSSLMGARNHGRQEDRQRKARRRAPTPCTSASGKRAGHDPAARDRESRTRRRALPPYTSALCSTVGRGPAAPGPVALCDRLEPPPARGLVELIWPTCPRCRSRNLPHLGTQKGHFLPCSVSL